MQPCIIFQKVYLLIAPCLKFKEFCITAIQYHQFFMRAHLNALAELQEQDHISHSNGRKAMADQNGRLALDEFRKALKNLILRPGIECARWLIQNQ